MIRVQLENLSKRFDDVPAVDGVSLEVRAGEFMVVLGPSGAGKTTLARLVAGLEQPDAGEIRFDDRALTGVAPDKRRVGFVFQTDSLWPHLSVAANVGYGLRLRGISRRERASRVDEALNVARIDGLANKKPDALSPIQKQRAVLARALVTDPELLILDEPLGPLDPLARVELRDQLQRIHADIETTTLMFTRDHHHGLALGQRLSIMDLGRVIQTGPPAELYNRPANALAARLLGPVNLVQGQAENIDAKGGVVVRTPMGRLVGSSGNGPLASGTPVTLMIRPELLSFAANAAFNANRFAATVERLVFLGTLREVHLRGPGDWPLTALIPQSLAHSLREGQSVNVSVPPESVCVLPTTAAPAHEQNHG